MFEKLEIEKKEDKVYILVKLKKKTGRRIPTSFFSWKKAKEMLEKRYPDCDIGMPLEKKGVLENTTDNLEDSWVFPINLKVKKETKLAEKQVKVVNKTRIKKKQKQQVLTSQKDGATVEGTKQSDQPAIVQEPTE
jgi:hypothetical protein